MKRWIFMLCLMATTAQADNRIFSPQVKTLTSTVNGDWQNRPVMMLGSSDVLHIGFDELSHDVHRYSYHLTRCEADWTESTSVFESDWLEGFNDLPIDDYQHSINTTVAYTHYQLQLPNTQCRLRMSGNYRLTISDEDSGETVAEVEFYVAEQVMGLQLCATSNTDIDVNQRHQQLSIAVSYNGLRVVRPDEEVKLTVMQNWCSATAVTDAEPTFTHQQGLRWEHCPALIFAAGNEYHKFEVLDVSHATMGLDRIEWDGHHYQAYPTPSTTRRNYLTDESAAGAFYIRNSDRQESDVACDYVWVNYRLEAPYEGTLYIDGLWTNSSHRNDYLLSYDEQQHCYTARIMQKQGYYSYRYAKDNGLSAEAEGCFYQTRNRYQVLVYYRSTADRTWRLVGYRGLDVR